MSDGASTQVFYPACRYKDAAAAIAWLGRAFGFTEHVVYPGPNGTIGHAELRFEGGLFMLGSLRDDDYPIVTPEQLGGRTAGIYVAVTDIDAAYARAKAAGATIQTEIHDTDYGSRDFAAFDCEGQLWSFGTYRP